MRGQRLCGQPVELGRRRVAFDLTIPRVRIVGREPFPECGELLGSELLDLTLERMIPSARSRSLSTVSAILPGPFLARVFGGLAIDVLPMADPDDNNE
jgi:hypothetical protein